MVELTLALYQTLDLDNDRVVWDVGHSILALRFDLWLKPGDCN